MPRSGFALLLALATIMIGGSCALALWHTRASASRALTLDAARLRATAAADSALLTALEVTDAGGWRTLLAPAEMMTVLNQTSGQEYRRAEVARIGWATLLVRGAVAVRSGVPQVVARADHRVLIPLTAPLPMPAAALTGARPWSIDPGAAVGLAPAVPAEVRCRAGLIPASIRQDSLARSLDASLVTPLDPDTVSAPLVGVFRLTRDRITRPMVIVGIVESVTGLSIGADLHLTGVLVVRESVQPAGGQLHVNGAIVAGDAGAAHSTFGNGDSVRYDACAIRHAVARATRPGPSRTWTTLRLF